MSVSRFIRAASPSLNLEGWRVGPSGPQGSVRKTGKLSKRARKPRPDMPNSIDWSLSSSEAQTSSASRSSTSIDYTSESSISSTSSSASISASSTGSVDSRPRFRALRFFRRKRLNSDSDSNANNRETIASFCNASTCSVDSIPEVPPIPTARAEKRRTVRSTPPLNLDRLFLDLEVAHHREMQAAHPLRDGLRPNKVLDIGCGVGLWVLDTAHIWTDTHFVGFDNGRRQFSLDTVDESVRKRIQWANGGWETLPFSDGEFDYVRASFIGHRLTASQWTTVIAGIRRVLRQGGSLEIVDEDIAFPAVTADSGPRSEPTLLQHLFECHLARRNVRCKVSATLPPLLNQSFSSTASGEQDTVRAPLRRPKLTVSTTSDVLWDDESGVGLRSKRLALPPEFFEQHWTTPAARHASMKYCVSTAPSMISLPDFLVFEPDSLNALFEEPLPTAFSGAADPYNRTDGYDADDQDSNSSISGDLTSPESPEFPETPRDGVFDETSRAGPPFVSSRKASVCDRVDGVPSCYFPPEQEDEDEEVDASTFSIDLSNFPVVPILPLAAVARTRVPPSIASSRSTERLSRVSWLTVDSADTVVGANTGFRAATSPYRPSSIAARLAWDIKSHRALLRVLSLREEMYEELQHQLADRDTREILTTKYGWREDEPYPRREFDVMLEKFVGMLFGRAGRTVAWARGEDSGCTGMDFVLRWSVLRE